MSFYMHLVSFDGNHFAYQMRLCTIHRALINIFSDFAFGVGFDHEHMRPDRDDYITLLSGAPKACQDFNYDKHDAGLVLTYGIDYDYCSVMHYGQFDSDCIMTPKHAVSCTVKGQKVTQIGQRIGLSELDIEEINKRYNCDGRYISVTYICQILSLYLII